MPLTTGAVVGVAEASTPVPVTEIAHLVAVVAVAAKVVPAGIDTTMVPVAMSTAVDDAGIVMSTRDAPLASDEPASGALAPSGRIVTAVIAVACAGRACWATVASIAIMARMARSQAIRLPATACVSSLLNLSTFRGLAPQLLAISC